MSKETNQYEIFNTTAGKKILKSMQDRVLYQQRKAMNSKSPQEAFIHINISNAINDLYYEFLNGANLSERDIDLTIKEK